LPHLLDALCEGEISFDKLRALVDVATPSTDAELRDRARECTVREAQLPSGNRLLGAPLVPYRPTFPAARIELAAE
jgi:hypothetical protein